MIPGQPHQATHALGGSPLQQCVELGFVQQPVQAIGHRLPELFGDQGAEPGRCEPKLLDRIEGSLTGRIEFPQLVELITEQFKPDGQLAADGKNVNDVPSPAPGPFLVNGGDLLVSQLCKPSGEFLKID